jgi:hypothetical protein
MNKPLRGLKAIGAATMLVVAVAAPFSVDWPSPLKPPTYTGTAPFFAPAEVLVRDPSLVESMLTAGRRGATEELEAMVQRAIRLDPRELELVAPSSARPGFNETPAHLVARYQAARYAFEIGGLLPALLLMPSMWDGPMTSVENPFRGQAEFRCLTYSKHLGPEHGHTAYACRGLVASGNAEVRRLASIAPAIIEAKRNEGYLWAAAQVAFVWAVLLASLIAYLLRERIFTWLERRSAAVVAE